VSGEAAVLVVLSAWLLAAVLWLLTDETGGGWR
jgi:hypothetical protein